MIILYSNDCPKCKILKFKLDTKNVAYDLCSDIEIMKSKGFQSTPMLEVEETTMNYLDAINWVKGQ